MLDFEYDEVVTSKQYGVHRYFMAGTLVAKTCRKCDQIKLVNYFNRLSKSSDGLKSECRACASASNRARYTKDPERVLAANRAWVAEHQTEKKQSDRRWREKNSSRKRETDRAWYEANRDKANASSRAWYANNRERAHELGRAWTANNRDKVADSAIRYSGRLKERSLADVSMLQAEKYPDGVKLCKTCGSLAPLSSFYGYSFTPDGLSRMCKPCEYIRTNARRKAKKVAYWTSVGIDPTFCFYCEFPIYDGDEIHSDHVIAEYNGGPDIMENQVPTCRSCNVCKNDKYFLDFLDHDFPYLEDQENILTKLRQFGIDWTLPRREH